MCVWWEDGILVKMIYLLSIEVESGVVIYSSRVDKVGRELRGVRLIFKMS